MNAFSVSWFLPRAVLVRGAIASGGLLLTLPLLAALGFAESVGIGTGLCFAASALSWLPSALTLVPLLVNSTTVQLLPDRVDVSHGPIPWFAGPELARGEVLSFEVMPSGSTLVLIPALEVMQHRRGFGRRHHHTRWSSEAIDAGGGWSVEAVLVGGAVETIASGIRHKEDAVALRDQLTAWLGRPAEPSPDDLSLFSPHA